MKHYELFILSLLKFRFEKASNALLLLAEWFREKMDCFLFVQSVFYYRIWSIIHFTYDEIEVNRITGMKSSLGTRVGSTLLVRLLK